MIEPFVISVILNTNRKDDTLECLKSLMGSSYRHHKVIVLDNQSTDESVNAIGVAFPQVTIINLKENLGYAGNNNVGIKIAMDQGADWIFLLNEDTILDRVCLSLLVDVGMGDSAVGIVGPMVYHYNEPGIIQSAGGKFDKNWRGFHLGQNEIDTGQFPQAHPVDWISGCGIMVRRQAIDDVGIIDDRFFYYKEEAEWCLRINKAGWKIMHVPAARLWHKGVQRDYKPKPSVTYYATRNWLLMLSKHKAPLMVRLRAWGYILRTLTSWTIKPKWRSMHGHRDAMWRGSMDYLRHRWGKMPG